MMPGIIAIVLQRGGSNQDAELVWESLKDRPAPSTVYGLLFEIDHELERIRGDREAPNVGGAAAIAYEDWKASNGPYSGPYSERDSFVAGYALAMSRVSQPESDTDTH